MAYRIRRIDYFYTCVKDEPGEALNLLKELAAHRINLLAFAAVPTGVMRTLLTLFPEDTPQLVEASRRAHMDLDGPYGAILVQGDDELGAIAGIHAKLYEAQVNVFASSGVADGKGSYGYVIYVRPEEYDRAVKALEI
jgi:predicted amino acid-binding ACT domain protein